MFIFFFLNLLITEKKLMVKLIKNCNHVSLHNKIMFLNQKKRMIDYLKHTELYSLIIMAVHETTSDRGWKKEWIDYVDGYGSNTVMVDGRVIVNEGCPFSVCE